MKTQSHRFHTLNTFATNNQTQVAKQRKELLQEEIAKIQDSTTFEYFEEFKHLEQDELILSIKYNVSLYYDPFLQQEFSIDQHVQELIYNVRRKYPWITILEKRIAQTENPCCQIQILSIKHQLILCNKPFNNTRHIIDLLKLYIARGTIQIKTQIQNGNIIPLEGGQINLFEDAIITLSQVDRIGYEKNKIPPKLLVISKELCEYTTFKDIPLNEYHIEITGKHVKYHKQKVIIGDNQVIIQRNDILLVKSQIFDKKQIIEATYIVNNITIPINNNEYKFWTKIGKEYTVRIDKQDYYPQSQSFIAKGQLDYKLNFDLIQKQKTILQITTKNIVDHTILNEVEIKIDSKTVGKTNSKGILIICNLDFKNMHITAYKKGFLLMPLDYEINAHNIGDTILIQMLPDYFSLMNQFHVIVIQPRLIKNIRFQLNNSKASPIQEKNHKIKDGNVVNFGIHINKTDAFEKENNIFQLSLINDKEVYPTYKMDNLKQTVTTLSGFRQKTRGSLHNIEIMTDRVLPTQVNENAQITIYLTFGFEIICQTTINQLDLHSRTYALVDLIKRNVQLNGKNYDCFKRSKTQKNSKNQGTDQILKLLTNNINY